MKPKVLIATWLLACSALHAQSVEVKDAWVRATVPGQMGPGAFMKLTARDGTRLIGISTPVAGVAELHEMKMEGDVMKMRALPMLDLPAGKTVELKAGGNHLMMMDLKQALPKGSTVPLTLRFKDAKGAESQLELTLPVSAVAPGAAAAMVRDKGHKPAAESGQHQH